MGSPPQLSKSEQVNSMKVFSEFVDGLNIPRESPLYYETNSEYLRCNPLKTVSLNTRVHALESSGNLIKKHLDITFHYEGNHYYESYYLRFNDPSIFARTYMTSSYCEMEFDKMHDTLVIYPFYKNKKEKIIIFTP